MATKIHSKNFSHNFLSFFSFFLYTYIYLTSLGLKGYIWHQIGQIVILGLFMIWFEKVPDIAHLGQIWTSLGLNLRSLKSCERLHGPVTFAIFDIFLISWKEVQTGSESANKVLRVCANGDVRFGLKVGQNGSKSDKTLTF